MSGVVMRKKNVFLVSGRNCGEDGYPQGEMVNYVVCAVSEERVRRVVAVANSDFAVVSVTPLPVLEDTVKKVKAVLAGEDTRWSVLMDPELQPS